MVDGAAGVVSGRIRVACDDEQSVREEHQGGKGQLSTRRAFRYGIDQVRLRISAVRFDEDMVRPSSVAVARLLRQEGVGLEAVPRSGVRLRLCPAAARSCASLRGWAAYRRRRRKEEEEEEEEEKGCRRTAHLSFSAGDKYRTH